MNKHQPQFRSGATTKKVIRDGRRVARVAIGSSAGVSKQTAAAASLTKVIHVLANTFCVLNFAIGITGLPPDATPRDERSFVLMWLAIIVGVNVWLGTLVYFMR